MSDSSGGGMRFRTPGIDFAGNLRRWMLISGALIVVSIGALLVRGLNLSIEFEGGMSFVLQEVEQGTTADQLRATARDAGAADVTAQMQLEGGEVSGALVRTAATTRQGEPLEPGNPQAQAIQEALVEVSGAQNVELEFVGPTWGEQISRNAVQALIVFLFVVAAYISWRLEPKMAGAAVAALIHDVFITVGLYALVGFLVSPSTVIALLTILGYSLYDSVVVFDRVEENARHLGSPGRRTYGQMVNTSMNEVFWRSLNTSVTSLLPVGGLLFIGSQLLGAETLQDLALALFIGMALGTYSSLFVAGPILAWWKGREPENVRRHERVERSGGEAAAAVAVEEARQARAPITTDYVRGPGRKGRSERDPGSD